MKKSILPEIPISDSEKIWLKKIYEKFKNNEQITYRIVRTALLNKLPKDFNPDKIDHRLAGYNGMDITLSGINTIAPKDEIIPKANKILETIRDFILSDSNLKTIKAEEIATKAKIPEKEVRIILNVIRNYGTFWQSAGSDNKFSGLSTFDIGDNDKVFDEYFHFTSIENLINKYYEKHNPRKNNDVIDLELKEYSTGLNQDNSIRINPIFTSRIAQVNTKLCFVLMPFKEKWSERVYKNYIKKIIDPMGIECIKADSLTGQIIMEDIWVNINQAAFIIADVTNRNPNVMYELGIAHTLGKHIILITQDLNNIPFDLTHLRHFQYEYTPWGEEVFTVMLKEVVSSIYKSAYPHIIL